MITSIFAALAFFTSVPSHVAVVHEGDSWKLTVDGKPFVVKGVGGNASRELLVKSGANTYRTWGANEDETKLDEAQRLGLKVTVGIWLGHKEHGFKYDNPGMVAKQLADAKATILKYKDHPALLMWGLGNEMEGYDGGDDPAVWKAVQDIARMAKELDPNHPTMTIVAEIGGKKVPAIQKMCPSVDIIGINAYGGASSIYERYVKQGGTKPYMITEFGPPGTWETAKTGWDAPLELTSTEKESWYAKGYTSNVIDHPNLCLGTYAFLWSHKQEATATWFGMFLPDGTKVGAVDVMTKLWTGKEVENPCPQISKLEVKGPASVEPGKSVEVVLSASDPKEDELTPTWTLTKDSGVQGLNGDKENSPDSVSGALVQTSLKGAKLKMPEAPGSYRLFVVVKNKHNGAAVANVPLEVRLPSGTPGEKASLPFNIYSESADTLPFAPSGWMGDAAKMKIDLAEDQAPHSGATCLRWDFNGTDGWGAIAWQSPHDDWGDEPGGFNLTGAKKLVVYAKGGLGGEKITFSVGIIKPPKKYFDTAVVTGKEQILTNSWARYELALGGKDLSRIKTGLVITTAAQGRAQTIFLDDIRVE